MTREEEIISHFENRFQNMQGRFRTPKKQRIFSDYLTRQEFEELWRFARDEEHFSKMDHVVGTDDGDNLGFIYIMENGENIILALHEQAPKTDPVIQALTPEFPSLEWHERELKDLFGADVRGLPEGVHYPLPDNWPEGQYPMRKEWDPDKFDRDTMTYDDGGKENG